jgi:hypothetical protein
MRPVRLAGFAVGLSIGLLAPSVWADELPQPSPEMMRAVEVAANFVDTQVDEGLASAFASRDVVIVDNSSPYAFVGPNAVSSWAQMIREHMRGITELRHHFGLAQEFSKTGDRAYFSMPVTWTERYFGKPVTEKGAWVFVMIRDHGAWKIQHSIWGRTETTPHR